MITFRRLTVVVIYDEYRLLRGGFYDQTLDS